MWPFEAILCGWLGTCLTSAPALKVGSSGIFEADFVESCYVIVKNCYCVAGCIQSGDFAMSPPAPLYHAHRARHAHISRTARKYHTHIAHITHI